MSHLHSVSPQIRANNRWKQPDCPTFFSAITLSPLFNTCHANHCAHVIDYCENLIITYMQDEELDKLTKIVLIESITDKQCYYNIIAACLYIKEGETTHD
jgi:hypothetical protein